MNPSPSSSAAAAREAARHGDGTFGVQERAEAPVDLTGAPSMPAAERRLQSVLATIASAPDLPGQATAGRTSTTFRYVAEDGAEYGAQVLDNVVAVYAADTDARAEQYMLRLTDAPEDDDAAAFRVVTLLQKTVAQDRDIKAFAVAMDVADKRAALSGRPLDAYRTDSFGGTLILGRPGMQVRFDGYVSDDAEAGGSSMGVTLLTADHEERFRLVRVARTDGTESYRWYTEDEQPLSAWQVRGLDAEINDRAGRPEADSPLAPDLLRTAAASPTRP